MELGGIDDEKVDKKTEFAGVETYVTNHPTLLHNQEALKEIRKQQAIQEINFRVVKSNLGIRPFRSQKTIYTLAMVSYTFMALFHIRALQVMLESSSRVPKGVKITREKIIATFRSFSVTHSAEPIYRIIDDETCEFYGTGNEIKTSKIVENTLISDLSGTAKTMINKLKRKSVGYIAYLLIDHFRDNFSEVSNQLKYQCSSKQVSKNRGLEVLNGLARTI